MKYKMGFIFICLIICLFSIASMCAADVNETLVTNEDQSEEVTNVEHDDMVNVGTKDIDELSASTGTFSYLNKTINSNNNSDIFLTQDIKYTQNDANFSEGIIITRNVTIHGNGHIIDGNNIARIFKISTGPILPIFKNIIFKNGFYNGIGGAIYGNSDIINCTFINNHAHSGGAIAQCSQVINSTFINNSATNKGGAIYRADVINCIFINNVAELGGALYIDNYRNKPYSPPYPNRIYSNNVFINCSSDKGGAIFVDGGSLVYRFVISDSNFENCNASGGGAIYATSTSQNNLDIINCEFKSCNATNGSGGGIYLNGENCTCINCNFINCYSSNGGAIYFSRFDCLLFECGFLNCRASENGGALYGSRYAYNFNSTNNNFINCSSEKRGGAIYWCGISGTFNECIFIDNHAEYFGSTFYFDSLSEECIVINCNFKKNSVSHYSTFEPSNYINCSDIIENGSISGNKNAYKVISCSFNKKNTILISSDMFAVYNKPKYLIITLKDIEGNVIKGQDILINFNGAKKLTTNKNGQIKISSLGLVPKKYQVKLTFAGNINYYESIKNIKITVTKATPKITAISKTFKRTLKTKNYAIALKTNQNKVMKNSIVYLKVNKKTYIAKTNSKGVAIFKITNLIKKGRYTAIVTYKGNTYYNKLVKKVIIGVK